MEKWLHRRSWTITKREAVTVQKEDIMLDGREEEAEEKFEKKKKKESVEENCWPLECQIVE